MVSLLLLLFLLFFKKKVEEELDYNEIIEINNKKIKALKLEIDIKKKINSEKDKNNEQYKKVKNQLAAIKNLKEKNENIKIVY